MKTRKILSVLLAFATILTVLSAFASCGTKMPEKQKVDHVYRVTSISTKEIAGYNYVYFNNMFEKDGNIYLCGNGENTQTYNYDNLIYRLDMENKKLVPADLPTYTPVKDPKLQGNSNISNTLYMEDGTFWCLVYTWSFDSVTQNYSESSSLVHCDKKGNAIKTVSMEDIWGKNTDDEYHYISHTLAIGSNICFSDDSTLYILDSDGKVTKKISFGEANNGYVQRIGVIDDKTLGILYNDYSTDTDNRSFITLDVTTGKQNKTALDNETFGSVWQYFLGEGYSFYYSVENGIYGYDLASGTSTFLMDYLNSDITSNSVNDTVIVLSPDKFIATGYDEAYSSNVISIMERVPDEEIQEKYILTLATVDNSYSARRKAVLFNRTSDEYRLVVKNYEVDYDYEAGETYEQGVKRAVDALNNDILTGNVPDLLLLDDNTPFETYAAKGMFVNLYDYIDKDETLNRADYLPNIFTALETGNKLYRIMPSFSIETFVAKSKNVNGMTSWNIDQFTQWANALPEDVSVFDQNLTQDTLLTLFYVFAHDDFIDDKTGRCSFDTEDFKKLLTFIATLPEKSVFEEMDGADYDEAFWQEYDQQYKTDKAMLCETYLSSFSSFSSTAGYQLGTSDMSFIGLPVTEGNSGAIRSSNSGCYAIFKKSALKDGAWQFIRYYLSEEYQNSLSYEFPLLISALEKMADDAVEEDKNREISEYYQPITREIADKMLTYIRSVNRVMSNDSTVIDLIREEAAAFFAGQKSIDDTCKIIQNRVSTYISENR